MLSPASNNDKDLYEVKCHIRAQCAPPGPGKREDYIPVGPLEAILDFAGNERMAPAPLGWYLTNVIFILSLSLVYNCCTGDTIVAVAVIITDGAEPSIFGRV